eukprot:3857009-Pleurochrysis_carterae.AAC.2
MYTDAGGSRTNKSQPSLKSDIRKKLDPFSGRFNVREGCREYAGYAVGGCGNKLSILGNTYITFSSISWRIELSQHMHTVGNGIIDITAQHRGQRHSAKRHHQCWTMKLSNAQNGSDVI